MDLDLVWCGVVWISHGIGNKVCMYVNEIRLD